MAVCTYAVLNVFSDRVLLWLNKLVYFINRSWLIISRLWMLCLFSVLYMELEANKTSVFVWQSCEHVSHNRLYLLSFYLKIFKQNKWMIDFYTNSVPMTTIKSHKNKVSILNSFSNYSSRKQFISELFFNTLQNV